MKRLAPADGDVMTRVIYCALLVFLIHWPLGVATASEGPATQERDFLRAQRIIEGGFKGRPSTLPGSPPTGPFNKLQFPASVAVRGPDLYVADIGQALLIRIDLVSNALIPLRNISALRGVRLKTAHNGDALLIEPGHPQVEELARDGRRIAVYSAPFDVLQPADVLVTPTGKLWISDYAGAIFDFHPSGRMAYPLTGRGDGFPDDRLHITLMTSARNEIVGFDPTCRCVVVLDENGLPLGQFGQDDLLAPIDLAQDAHGRTWVIDRGDQQLKIFENGALIASLVAARLGITEFSAIAIDAFDAYIADGPSGRIGVFTIIPPRK